MKIQIRENSGAPSDSLRAHVQRKLDFALSGFQEQIGSVTVRLSPGEPAPKGGGKGPGKGRETVKRCEIEVRLRPRTVGVQDTDVDLLVAVDNAAGRLQRSIARALNHDLDGQAERVRSVDTARRPR